MFQGSHDHVVDDKGRTSLPKDFRVQLAKCKGDPCLTPLRDCLAIFSRDDFEALCARLSEASSMVDSIQRAQRLIIGMAVPCPFDKSGRILIPQRLRDWAQIRRDVVLTGVGNRIEVWDRARHEAELQQVHDSYAEHMRELKEFGL